MVRTWRSTYPYSSKQMLITDRVAAPLQPIFFPLSLTRQFKVKGSPPPLSKKYSHQSAPPSLSFHFTLNSHDHLFSLFDIIIVVDSFPSTTHPQPPLSTSFVDHAAQEGQARGDGRRQVDPYRARSRRQVQTEKMQARMQKIVSRRKDGQVVY